MSTSQNPLNYDPTDPDKMALPVGSTCWDCMHINKCKAMYGHTETDTSCDWSPSKFKNACQGIDTADLKSGSVSIIHKLHDEAAKRVLAQRDELLAALKVFQDQCEMMESANWRKWKELASPEEFERWVKIRATHMALQARAAIAKVEGGA